MAGLMYPGGDSKVKGVTRLARGVVGDNEYVGINTTVSDRKYKCLILFVGQTTDYSPSIQITGGSYSGFETLYFDYYLEGKHYATNVGWLYIIKDLKFPVQVKVDYYPNTYGNRNVTLWGIY